MSCFRPKLKNNHIRERRERNQQTLTYEQFEPEYLRFLFFEKDFTINLLWLMEAALAGMTQMQTWRWTKMGKEDTLLKKKVLKVKRP